eukprot:Rmarinus@m.11339
MSVSHAVTSSEARAPRGTTAFTPMRRKVLHRRSCAKITSAAHAIVELPAGTDMMIRLGRIFRFAGTSRAVCVLDRTARTATLRRLHNRLIRPRRQRNLQQTKAPPPLPLRTIPCHRVLDRIVYLWRVK